MLACYELAMSLLAMDILEGTSGVAATSLSPRHGKSSRSCKRS